MSDPLKRKASTTSLSLMEPLAMPSASSSSTTSVSTPKEGLMEDGGFTKILTKEEKRKLRKVEKHRPQFQFDISHFRQGKKIGIAHIRDLALHIVADGQRPTWIVAENRNFMSHTVILFVPGLLPQHLGLEPIPTSVCLPFSTTPSPVASTSTPPPRARVPIIPKLFTYAVPSRAPGDQRKLHSVMSTLLNSPLPDGVRKKREAESRRLASLTKGDQSNPLLYLLSPNQMLDNDYQLPSYINPSDTPYIPGDVPDELAKLLSVTHQNETLKAKMEFTAGPTSGPSMARSNGGNGGRERGNKRDGEWVETPEAEGPPPNGVYPVLAIDCEMCQSADGQELARVSIIDYHSGLNVFDELVKPPVPIVDYLTQWSGMTAARLSTATHTVKTIQQALFNPSNPVITPHTILLGHSLECDLAALRIRHPLCIDTSVIYKHPRGPPYKAGLKWLSGKWLGRDIQGDEGGHDSEEDARACVDLLRLKLANGPDFGDAMSDTESIFERISRFKPTSDPTKLGKTTAMCDYGNPRGWYGAKATTTVACTNDDEVLEGMIQNVEKHDLVFGRFMELGNVQGWNGIEISNSDPLPKPHSEPSEPLPSTPERKIDQALENFNKRLTKLHESLPKSTALILLTGHSDPRPMLEMISRRQKWERLVKLVGVDRVPREERWMSEDDRVLETVVGECREGMGFFCVK